METQCNIKYLDAPVKSNNDLKTYKVIVLNNGLTALLISDTQCNQNQEDNEAEIKTNKMAACGLCINAGSFSDPPEIQGLAHFLEHMVFLGSTKYPKENDFNSFISSNGGTSNASTSSEMTTFYFDLPVDNFENGLKRFTQLIIAPLLKTEVIVGESEVIESEFQIYLPNDSNKKEQIIALTVQENHPAGQFSYGNLESLGHIDSEDLKMELHNFREKYYSAHKMTLAIQACLPLGTIEQYVLNYFSKIPCNNLPSLNFENLFGSNSFDMIKFHKMYTFKSSSNVCKLELLWAMPSFLSHYRSKPNYYVSWLIGHEGKGSLISLLRRKFWAFDLSAGTEGSNSIFSLYHISIDLTDEGFYHIPEICGLTFAYINMLKKMRPLKRIFDEIQHIENVIFQNICDEDPIDNVKCICQRMQFYPSKDYLTGANLVFEFDEEEISKCIHFLDPEKICIIIQDSNSEIDKFDKVEHWFKTRFCEEEIPETWVENWKTAEPRLEFHIPEPNVFLTTDFSLVDLPDEIPDYPVKIFDDPLIQIWHRPDKKFRNLECCISLSLKTPYSDISPYNSAMADLLNTILQRVMKEEVYAATITKLEHVLCTSPRGIVVLMNGWSQKLPLLLYTITKYYVNFFNLITKEIFEMGKEQELKWYYNTMIDTHELKRDIKMSILVLSHWSKMAKYAALKEVTFDQFIYFVSHFWDNLEISMLVQGNMTPEDAIHHGLTCACILNCKPLLSEMKSWTRITQIPVGERCCKIKHVDLNDANSAVTNYYQTKDTSLRVKMIIEILTMIMEQPLYDQLRTAQHLTYLVYCELENDYGVYGFSITVYTQVTKHSTMFIDEKIEEFIQNFKEKLTNMSDEEFENVKKTLTKLKNTEDNNLNEEFSRNWQEVEIGRYAFDRLEKDVNIIPEIGLNELREWFEEHTLGGDKCRKISIQVVGNEKENDAELETLTEDLNNINVEEEEEEEENENLNETNIIEEKVQEDTNYRLQYLTNLENEDSSKPEEYYITNIEHFKKSLKLFPITYTSY